VPSQCRPIDRCATDQSLAGIHTIYCSAGTTSLFAIELHLRLVECIEAQSVRQTRIIDC